MAEPAQRVTVGTRGSALALRQTEIVVDTLRRHHPTLQCTILPVQTEGDRNQRDALPLIGDKGVFVRAIERALLAGTIDLAVHSLKDVPSDVTPAGLQLTAVLPREDPRDVVVSPYGSLDDLPPAARVGTGSPRRRALLTWLRPDLILLNVRGNVDTRLRKLDAGQYDALILAAAGLKRLGLERRISSYLPPDRFVPDAGQGTIAVETRVGGPAAAIVATIDDPDSRIAAVGERAVVRALNADCHTPVGAYLTVEGDEVGLIGMVATETGTRVVHERVHGHRSQVEALGRALGERLEQARRRASVY